MGFDKRPKVFGEKYLGPGKSPSASRAARASTALGYVAIGQKRSLTILTRGLTADLSESYLAAQIRNVARWWLSASPTKPVKGASRLRRIWHPVDRDEISAGTARHCEFPPKVPAPLPTPTIRVTPSGPDAGQGPRFAKLRMLSTPPGRQGRRADQRWTDQLAAALLGSWITSRVELLAFTSAGVTVSPKGLAVASSGYWADNRIMLSADPDRNVFVHTVCFLVGHPKHLG